MSHKPTVLFVCNKWCEGNPELGVAEWEKNLEDSLRSLEMAEVCAFHLDEYYQVHSQNGDNALLETVKAVSPDLVFLVTAHMPGTSPFVPGWASLAEISGALAIPIVSIWGDVQYDEHIAMCKALQPYCALTLATASSAAVTRLRQGNELCYIWPPKNPDIFKLTPRPRDIGIGYFGSPKPERMKVIEALRKNSVDAVVHGGERQEHLTVEMYAELYCRTRIALSFARANHTHVVNARPFEAMHCGAMLLEQESFELAKLYVPYKEYVPYTGLDDLIRKAKYYTERPEECAQIAGAGHKKTLAYYSAQNFWQFVFGKVLSNQKLDIPVSLNLPADHLTELSPGERLRYLALHHMNSSAVIFPLYHFWVSPVREKGRYLRRARGHILNQLRRRAPRR